MDPTLVSDDSCCPYTYSCATPDVSTIKLLRYDWLILNAQGYILVQYDMWLTLFRFKQHLFVTR